MDASGERELLEEIMACCETEEEQRVVALRSMRDRYGVTGSTVAIWHRDGKLPAPLLVGGLNMWRLAELQEWESSGCPSSSVLAGVLSPNQADGIQAGDL
jgi:hypothetical protein